MTKNTNSNTAHSKKLRAETASKAQADKLANGKKAQLKILGDKDKIDLIINKIDEKLAKLKETDKLASRCDALFDILKCIE